MSRYKIKYAASFQSDVDAIYDYISSRLQNPIAATKTVSKIICTCDALALFPKGNSAKLLSRNIGFRFVHTGKYTIVYHVDDVNKTVFIDYVMYSRRDILKILAG